MNESLFARNFTKAKAPDNEFELERITQFSSDDMFPQYIKKKPNQKTKQAKKKKRCSLSQLKKTRSNTIRCVCHVWKCEQSKPSLQPLQQMPHLLSFIDTSVNKSTYISHQLLDTFPLVQQRPGCSARPWGLSPSLTLNVDDRSVFVVRTTGSPAGGLPLPHFHLWKH